MEFLIVIGIIVFLIFIILGNNSGGTSTTTSNRQSIPSAYELERQAQERRLEEQKKQQEELARQQEQHRRAEQERQRQEEQRRQQEATRLREQERKKENFINNIAPQIRKASFTELSDDEVLQTADYIWIYKSNHCQEHYEVNNIISKDDRWDDFSSIRSLNDHGYVNNIKGITPKFFAIICKVLHITGADGNPLIDYKKY